MNTPIQERNFREIATAIEKTDGIERTIYEAVAPEGMGYFAIVPPVPLGTGANILKAFIGKNDSMFAHDHYTIMEKQLLDMDDRTMYLNSDKQITASLVKTIYYNGPASSVAVGIPTDLFRGAKREDSMKSLY